MSVTRKMAPAFLPIERDRREHMRGRAFIYLQIIGVAPRHQGKGFGGRLLRAIIAESEQEGRPLYLETETEENVRLYERFGFRVIRKLILPGLELPMWEMAREPGA
jgi:ribosomal protein S18 acetylase RimI-like enzyme